MPDQAPPAAPAAGHGHRDKRRQYAAKTQAYFNTPTRLRPTMHTPPHRSSRRRPVLHSRPRPATHPQLAAVLCTQRRLGLHQRKAAAAHGCRPDDGVVCTDGHGRGRSVSQLEHDQSTYFLARPAPTTRPVARDSPALNSSVTPSPVANADPSYQPHLVIPSLQIKVPLAHIPTPYWTLNEGEEPVPVVTDTDVTR